MTQPPKVSRRAVLTGASVAGLAATGAATAAGVAADDEPGEAVRDVRHVEMKDTDHIRTYYALARR